MERSELAILIPAWNEERTIGRVVRSVAAHGTSIVVNDCSSDRTSEVAREAGAVVVDHAVNGGYDQALNSAFAKAAELGCRYAVTFDADGQHSAELLLKFAEALENKTDLVLGVRPTPARAAEHAFAIYTRLRYGVRDPLCGMKGYRMSVYRERGHFDSYSSVGTELALWAVRQGHSFTQIEVPIAEREDAPRFGRLLRANLRILRAMGMDVLGGARESIA